jgi:hypothetical protein
MKQFYFRRVKCGGLHILQVIAFRWVIGYTRNTSLQNGEKGSELYIKSRSRTAL